MACAAVLITTSAVLSFRDYFVVWAGNTDLRDHYFDGQFVDLAAAMNQLDDPEGVWILPISALASPHDEAGHHTVEFLYRGQAPFHFLRLDESTVADELSTLTRDRSKVLLVDYKNYLLEEAYNYIDADPKKLVPFILGKHGRQQAQHEFETFDVRIYALPAAGDLSIAGTMVPVSADIGGQLKLTGVSHGVHATDQPEYRELPSGDEAWVVLQWRSIATPDTDYKVALFLLDERDMPDKLLSVFLECDRPEFGSSGSLRGHSLRLILGYRLSRLVSVGLFQRKVFVEIGIIGFEERPYDQSVGSQHWHLFLIKG